MLEGDKAGIDMEKRLKISGALGSFPSALRWLLDQRLLWVILICLCMFGVAQAGEDVICEFCGMTNCTMGCKDSSIDDFGNRLMLMPGLPAELYYGSIVVILLVSFGLSEFLDKNAKPDKKYWVFNLFKIGFIRRLAKLPYIQFLFQLPVFLIFAFVVYCGLFGNDVINILPIATWTLWWAGLIFLIVFFGKAWCFMCPWDFVASLVQRLRFWGVPKETNTLGLTWPSWLKSLYPALVLFILLTWLELGVKVTISPRYTAYLALLMVVLAVIPALLFSRKPFCRYVCFVGRISGLYANFAPLEIRSNSMDVCHSCVGKACYNGNELGNPCPTGLVIPAIKANTYCTMCGECLKSCPHDNIALNIRPFGADLLKGVNVRPDEAALTLALLALTTFHGLEMTPLWEASTGFSVIGWLKSIMGTARLPAFTVGMAVCLVAPILVYWAIARITSAYVGDKNVSTKKVFVYYAFSLLPIALCYHVAHNGMHLFMEGQYIVPLLSDPMGTGADHFGTATVQMGPILSATTVWICQVILIVVGHVYGILFAKRISRTLYADAALARRSLIPMLGGMILFSLFSLWIMGLDMNMRSSLM